jgi:hypothetical protein
MTLSNSPSKNQLPVVTNNPDSSENKTEKILCNHCGRTATNGIKCRGICVSDSDY